MIQNKGIQERRKMRELIRMYKREGYEIEADYKDYGRPRPISGIVPDLVVKKDNREIIVEIVSDKSWPHLVEKMKILSEYAEKHVGTSFNLIITNPRTKRLHLSSEERELACEYLLKDLESKLLLEVRRLYDRGQTEASLLILFRLLGALLRRIACDRRLKPPKKVMSTKEANLLLYENRILTRDDFVFINRIIRRRNDLIHRRKPVIRHLLKSYIEFISTLKKSIK